MHIVKIIIATNLILFILPIIYVLFSDNAEGESRIMKFFTALGDMYKIVVVIGVIIGYIYLVYWLFAS